MAGNYYPILKAIQQIVAGLSLVDWNGNPLPSSIRKLPAVDETIDVLPLLAIVPKNEEPKRLALAFGPTYRVEYPCEIVFIAANNRDFSTHLSNYMGWAASVSAAFNTPSALKSAAPAVWDVRVRPGLVIDRQQVNDNYDYGGLTVLAITAESN